MNKIEKVRVFKSQENIHNGEDIGPGFGVIIDPHPTTDDNVFKVAQAIRNVLEGMGLNDERGGYYFNYLVVLLLWTLAFMMVCVMIYILLNPST